MSRRSTASDARGPGPDQARPKMSTKLRALAPTNRASGKTRPKRMGFSISLSITVAAPMLTADTRTNRLNRLNDVCCCTRM